MSKLSNLSPATRALFEQLADLYIREGFSPKFKQRPDDDDKEEEKLYLELAAAGLMVPHDGFYIWTEDGRRLVLELHPMSDQAAALLAEIERQPTSSVGPFLGGPYAYNELVARGPLLKDELDQYHLATKAAR